MSINYYDLGNEIKLIPEYKNAIKKLFAALVFVCDNLELADAKSEASSVYLGFHEDLTKKGIEL